MIQSIVPLLHSLIPFATSEWVYIPYGFLALDACFSIILYFCEVKKNV